jgi:hypothetical protein
MRIDRVMQEVSICQLRVSRGDILERGEFHLFAQLGMKLPQKKDVHSRSQREATAHAGIIACCEIRVVWHSVC